MRPERLRLAAFGAYAGEQEIDFAELGDHRLFLIHGPTGSGKTTLLDAICFALFGESSGDERDASDLRSHHAAPTRPTEVEFDFALGAEAFRIRRFPAQSLPGRGGRPVARTPEVTLWRRGLDESLSVLAETVTPVREALTELLGYTAAEFRQVVMLPQGRFRELLVAERGARKDILATLFRTAFYRRVEEALAALERDAREEVKAAEATRSALMSEAGAETVAEAEERAASAERAADAAERAALEAAQAAQEAERRLAAAREDARLIAEADAARLELATLETRLPEIEAQRQELAVARRAETLSARAEALKVLEGIAGPADAAAREQERRLAEAEARLRAAERALADAALREMQEQAARAEATRLASLLAEAEKLASAAEEAEQAEAALAEARRQAEAAAARRESAARRAEVAVAARWSSRALAATLADRRATLALAKARAAAARGPRRPPRGAAGGRGP